MALSDETAPARPERRECAYNLFRNNERVELFCAVPEHRPVPSFVAQAWSFDRILHVQDAAPSGFHNRAALAGVRFNGFYLFYATARKSQNEAPSVEDWEEA
ncbi:hypothetical protein [Microvirga arabica]|uniref:hypothetical protein n=1 Tax=Microvirga arabica TaxID=1128671 RepID=UPI00193A9EC1|nr:hypothetical protein [Microvirga arabica]MBM1169876.1 hypothetical protein [Microvirga arabica]